MKIFSPLPLLLLLFVASCSRNDDTTTTVCQEVTDIIVSEITPTSVMVSWSDLNASDSYRITYGKMDFAMDTGTTITENLTAYNLQNLEPATTYDLYIQAVCSNTNSSLYSEVLRFTTATPAVIPELRPTLSELNIFLGHLGDLNVTTKAFEYQLSTELFSDYAHKQRLIALPEDTTLEFNGDGLPIFPDNTVIAKTFFYYIDERDLTLGKRIVETRLLIKTDGDWITGDYVWNASQTEAILDFEGSTVPVSWIDADGENTSINYEIPSNTACFSCHNSYERLTPIGPKLRSMNFDINGSNQLDQFINDGILTGILSSSTARTLPNWEDTTLPLADRARAYIDINCAHCHIPGGDCWDESTLNLAYETTLEESLIAEQRTSIELRISTHIDGISMPLIGTTILHDEGVQLVLDYLNTLE